MPSVTSDDAKRSLEQIEQVGARSSRAHAYETFSRYFILWGAVWIAGQGASLGWPNQARYVWWALIVAAIALTCILLRRPRRPNWRIAAVVLIVLAFVAATHAVLGPVNARLDAAVLPLATAAVYTGLGLWLGVRFTIAGLALAAGVLGGVFLLGEDFRNWMGFVGGGALILAGLWLRRV